MSIIETLFSTLPTAGDRPRADDKPAAEAGRGGKRSEKMIDIAGALALHCSW
jgi:hypothetical protein